MTDEKELGFIELQHTADRAVRVWAPDYPALLIQSARAMYEIAGILLDQDCKVERMVELAASDDESLLVVFLSELLFLQETENLAFNKIRLRVSGFELQAWLSGAKIKEQAKEIKAVTYHNLNINRLPQGLEVTIVFDV
ncbi:MAG: archease [Anaerolineae bacterium]|nr:archease [Anaerolineae bacterium]